MSYKGISLGFYVTFVLL